MLGVPEIAGRRKWHFNLGCNLFFFAHLAQDNQEMNQNGNESIRKDPRNVVVQGSGILFAFPKHAGS